MKLAPYLALVLVGLFWSLNMVIGKIVTPVVPPITLTFFRWLLPCAVLLPLHRRELRENKRLLPARWPLILFLGATGYCLNSIGIYEAVRYTTAINASFINIFNPILIAALESLIYRIRITPAQLFGFVLSALGVSCLIFRGDWRLAAQLRANPGDLFALGTVIVWSIHPVVYKHEAKGLPEGGLFASMVIAGILLSFPPALVESLLCGWSWLGRVRAVHLLGILALGVFPSLLGYQLWNSALKAVPAKEAGIFLYLMPLYTTAFSFFTGERPGIYHLVAGGLIFSGVFLVTQKQDPGASGRSPTRSRTLPGQKRLRDGLQSSRVQRVVFGKERSPYA